MKKTQPTLLALALAGLLLSAAAQAETLDDTLSAAQGYSPQLDAARQGPAEARAQVQQAQSAFGPTVSLTASLGLNRYEARPMVPAQTFQPRAAGLSLSMPLYTSGLLDERLDGARSRERAAEAAAQQARQGVLFNAANAYLAVARATQLDELAQQHEHLLRSELERVQAELRNGLRTKTDAAQALARLAAAQAQSRSSASTLQTARIQYQALVGRMPQGALELPQVNEPQDQEDTVERVLAGNAQLRSSAEQQSSYGAQVAAARAADKLSVSLSASLSNDRENNPVLPVESSRTVMLRLSVPLFDSGLNRAQVSEAVAQQARAHAEHEALQTQVRADAESAWELLRSANAQVQARGQQVDAAAVALDGARAEYKAGTRTLLDVLNAEQELLSARTEALNAGYERLSSILRIRALQGQLGNAG